MTIDSDTVLDKRCIQSFLGQYQDDKDKRIGAITGNILAMQHSPNLLQKVISLRYFLAFNQERASQSIHGAVVCCSGPATMYRFAVISKTIDRYINQKFGGKKCTFGDDRHLTNLVLSEKLETKYDKFAIAYTDVPDNWIQYIKQQTRWSKSFIRETFVSLKIALKGKEGLRKYFFWELITGAVLPVLLSVNLILIFLTFSWIIWVKYLIIILVVALIRSLFGVFYDWHNGMFKYIYFPVFAFFNLMFLIPIKWYALITITNNKWGTR